MSGLAKRKHQEHLGSPSADPFDLHEAEAMTAFVFGYASREDVACVARRVLLSRSR